MKQEKAAKHNRQQVFAELATYSGTGAEWFISQWHYLPLDGPVTRHFAVVVLVRECPDKTLEINVQTYRALRERLREKPTKFPLPHSGRMQYEDLAEAERVRTAALELKEQERALSEQIWDKMHWLEDTPGIPLGKADAWIRVAQHQLETNRISYNLANQIARLGPPWYLTIPDQVSEQLPAAAARLAQLAAFLENEPAPAVEPDFPGVKTTGRPRHFPIRRLGNSYRRVQLEGEEAWDTPPFGDEAAEIVSAEPSGAMSPAEMRQQLLTIRGMVDRLLEQLAY
ncbi:hypothetical protein [Hymenobacter rigui]|uniref:Uncharacterized protein n=1 Tax=Hymenobacter rigui TaxID=334424 RepID=A0A428KG81_9BACT|nr:hypothetical protein [Hymenobacter rigui]RSK45481.1 hypothetical protein EI291_17955 [Hymenobacter rigui]